MNEIWKDIAGYEGLYQVSNLGQVRSLNYLHTGQTRILKPGKQCNGYSSVTLSKDGKHKRFSVHRLVAKAFLPNPLNLSEVNHLDEVKTNNVVSNLEWCSQKYNTNYGTCIERRAAKKSKPIRQYNKQGNLVKTWPSAMEIEKSLGFHRSNICRCCQGKLKSVSGYVWRYA